LALFLQELGTDYPVQSIVSVAFEWAVGVDIWQLVGSEESDRLAGFDRGH
jgi:hypothetical protein